MNVCPHLSGDGYWIREKEEHCPTCENPYPDCGEPYTKKHPYPECEKLKKAAPESHKIGFFLDWLESQGIHLAHWVESFEDFTDPDMLDYIKETREQLLARYFEIDLDKVETERRAILEDLRKRKREEEVNGNANQDNNPG